MRPSLFLLPVLLFGACFSLFGQDSLRQAVVLQVENEAPILAQVRDLIAYCGQDQSCHDRQLNWFIAAGLADYQSYYNVELSVYLRRQGNLTAARQALDQGLAACPAANSQLQGYLYNEMSVLLWRYLGQLDSGSVYAYLALDAFGERYRFDQHQPMMQLGQIKEQMGLYPEALQHYIDAFTRAELEPDNRFAYGYTLYHVLETALQLEKADVFGHYVGRYRDFLLRSSSINSQHDAMLNYLVNNEEAIVRLERILDDPQYESPYELMHGAAIGSLEFSHRLVAQAKIERGEYAEAEAHLRKSLQILQGNKAPIFQQEAYRLLIQIGRANKQPELLIEGLENYNHLQDSLNKASYQEQISEWEVRYATEKAQADLARAELEQAKTRRQRDSLLLGSGLLASLALGIFLLLRTRIRSVQRNNEYERQLQQQQIKELQRENELTALRSMIEGQEAERSRVAKDLHDGLGGLLATVKAHISQPAAGPKASEMVDRATKEVRRIAHNLMPTQLSIGGLPKALEDLAAQLRVQGYRVELELSPALNELLESSQQHTLLRITQELCQNVVKHAAAKSLLIQCLIANKQLLLIVEDDGKGFNLQYARQEAKGLGLSNIENRVTFLQGEILYDSRPGRGTTATINVPLPPRNYDRDTPYSL